MRPFRVLFFILGINSCQAQTISENKLIGKWILAEETSDLSDMEDFTPITERLFQTDSVPEEKLDTWLTFDKNKTVFVDQIGFKYRAKYKLRDSILTLGARKYILIKLDEQNLIFKVKDDAFNQRFKYKKVE